MVKSSKPWYLYLIQTQNLALYTGITTDLGRRWNEHNGKGKGAKFFRRSPPRAMVFACEYENRSQASKAEAEFKKLKRPEKLAIIASDRNQLAELTVNIEAALVTA